jgi:type VI secretion system protein ImpK
MSDPDDPFAQPPSDRTLIMPSPGARGLPRSQSSAAEIAGASTERSPRPSESATSVSGINPLVAAANPLLDIVPQLRSTPQHADPSGLRDYLAQNIKTFEARAKAAGVAPEKVIAGRYALCTLLDETAASTPWGGSGIWAKHSLLVMFHNETSGGEKFFQLLAKVAENPGANRDLLELMYICLALGFEGRYRVIENGRAQLEALRERLAQLLRRQQGDYERDLSPRWRGAAALRAPVFTMLPLWVVFAVCGVLLLAIFVFFRLRLMDLSDPVYAQIQQLRVRATAPPPVVPPTPPPKPRLATFLAPEIEAGQVTVRDESNKSVITIRGDNLFQPGSATISTDYLPLLGRIAEALDTVPGQVRVVGHTDNQPIRTMRFPSNWHLSEERANSVMRILTEKVSVARLSAEGRADGEPVADNATPEGRARNRRVEITLFAAPGGSP